jgi:CubicO group peptidase (beta-lactamase class C family)
MNRRDAMHELRKKSSFILTAVLALAIGTGISMNSLAQTQPPLLGAGVPHLSESDLLTQGAPSDRFAGGVLIAHNGKPVFAQAYELADHEHKAIPELLRNEHVASVSFAKIQHARTVLAEAYGEAGPGIPATNTTLYNIASMSKPISAEVILRLASAGRLSLDEPMFPYWVDPDLAADPRAKRLTARMALDHQTGFPNWRTETGGKLTFLENPGTGFHYSGEGYQYVARFAEKKTGKTFEQLAQALVFDPAGLRRTAYTERPWMDGHIAQPNNADGTWLKPQIATTFVAADLVYTTPAQYAGFIEGLMNGSGESQAIHKLRESVLTDRRAQLCVGKLVASCPEQVGMGPGWEVIKTHGKTFLMHTGNDPGVFTLGYFDPNARSGVVIFTNSSNGPKVILPILKMLDADPDFIAYLAAQV